MRMVDNVLRLKARYLETRGSRPQYVVLDPQSYRQLADEVVPFRDVFGHSQQGRDHDEEFEVAIFVGLHIVVVDVPEMCTVVGWPGSEARQSAEGRRT